MSDAQALVLLSEREGQSLAVLEALATLPPSSQANFQPTRSSRERYPEWVRIVGSAAEG